MTEKNKILISESKFRSLGCFFYGLAGALAFAITATLVVAQYSDYRAFSQTNDWLLQLQQTQREVEAVAMRQKSFVNAGRNIRGPEALGADHSTLVEVSDSGSIIVQGGKNGQVVMLAPSFSGDKVEWRCIGGPAKDVPTRCRRQ